MRLSLLLVLGCCAALPAGADLIPVMLLPSGQIVYVLAPPPIPKMSTGSTAKVWLNENRARQREETDRILQATPVPKTHPALPANPPSSDPAASGERSSAARTPPGQTDTPREGSRAVPTIDESKKELGATFDRIFGRK